MTVSAEARELAGKTATEIRRRGWARQTMAADPDALADCRVCLVGGIAAALTGNPEDGNDFVDGYRVMPTAARELADEIAMLITGTERWPDPLLHAIIWNDRQERTEAEVLALLDSIAADQ
jgi:hypothetical protein